MGTAEHYLLPGIIDCHDTRVHAHSNVIWCALRPCYARDASWRAECVEWLQRVLDAPQCQASLLPR